MSDIIKSSNTSPNSPEINEKDKEILKSLGKEFAELSSDPRNGSKAEKWRRLNDLEIVKPMVWISDVPWHEMDVNGELKPRVDHPILQKIEIKIRRAIYIWKHMETDIVIEGKIFSPPAVQESGIGIEIEEKTVETDPSNNILSRDFKPQLEDKEDIEKIEMPDISHDKGKSEKRLRLVREVFEDILPVEMGGISGIAELTAQNVEEESDEYTLGYSPWDDLTTLRGPERVLRDLAKRPDFVRKGLEKIIDTYISRLNQLEDMDLLARNDRNTRIGSGGYGYTDDLPASSENPEGGDLWGFSCAQILCDISPEMHESFAVEPEKRWLERFGLTYYGCCEPLHDKIDNLRDIPHLRKISLSPWSDFEKAAENVDENEYVLSIKPNPSILAQEKWKPNTVRKRIRKALEKTAGHNVEIVMKDISTVQYEPERLWEWTRIAQEESKRIAKKRGISLSK